MRIDRRPFGYTKDGERVDIYTLWERDLSVEVLDYGGIVRSFTVQTVRGPRDLVLGFDTIEGYETSTSYHGAIVGRIANRVGGARFSLNGKNYDLEVCDGENCLHSGSSGYSSRLWYAEREEDELILMLRDRDGEGGFPGNLETEVHYKLRSNRLIIEYTAKCDEDTPINLTNHCYFNLGGHDSGGIDKHKISILGNYITTINDKLIPTGELLDVTGTPFDLRNRTQIGIGLASNHPQILLGGGYDHNYVLSRETSRPLALSAVLEYDGLMLQCLTTQPGIQLYSGNFLDGEAGKNGAVYNKRSGLCLETQGWPDAVNHPEFPSSILRKGEVYSHITEYAIWET